LIVRIEQLFEDGLREGIFSGASLLAAARGTILFERQWGHTRSGGSPISTETRFDLASLTKILVTTPLAVCAASTGALRLDHTLDAFFAPDVLPADKRDISIRHLLNHCSGLPAYRPFYRDLISLPPPSRRPALLDAILRTPLAAPPGTVACYSDLGFLLLGIILEKLFDGRLDRVARKMVFDPFRIDSLHFRSMEVPTGPEIIPSLSPAGGLSFAATEHCPWRKRLLVGEVHDENCYCLGGVAGHAGLFGTARGIFTLLSRFLDIAREGSGEPAWSSDILAEFWSRQGIVPDSTWALGFDTPSASNSSAGRFFSPRSVGHLGFSGTSAWMDLERSVIIILLTNRIYPTRCNEKLKAFRPSAHDLTMELLHATQEF